MTPIKATKTAFIAAALATATLFAAPALGAITASPNPSTTGSYTVSGSVSTSVSYQLMQLWERQPDNTTATYSISDASNISRSFSSKPVGTYVYQVEGCNYELQEGTFRLILVCMGIGDLLSVTVTSAPSNIAPVADAGDNQTVRKRASVTLSGSGSDADGDSLTYAWSQTSGTTVTLSSTTAASPTFAAPATTGALVFSLVVNDGTVSSTADTVTVTVTNTRPVAEAGANQTVRKRASVTLSGSGSDADGDSLTYAWSQTSGTTVTLSGATAASPTFAAPATTGALVFSLVVNDGTINSTADTVTVTVTNTRPVAEAGANQTVRKRASVTLSGSGSDADGDSLTYAWSQSSGTTVTLSSTTAARPTFTAPATTGALVFSLVVNDGTVSSTADTVTVTVTNTRPVAEAGSNQTVDTGASVTLSGSGSDADGDSLTYAWSQTSGTTVSLSGATTASPTFTAPSAAATLVFSLAVNDGTVSSTADTVTVTAIVPVVTNTRPVADAGANQTVRKRASVTLSGSGSDADGDSLTYAWSQTSGTTVSLSGATTASPTFTAPSAAATLVFSLAVNDGTISSTADTVTVTVTNTRPVAEAGANQTVRKRASVTLSGSGSDADSDTLTYAWRQSSGTTVTLSSATAARPTFTAPATTGALVFSLVVNDGTVSSTADTVTVTVTNTRPVANAGSNKSVTEGNSATLSGSGSDADGDSLTYAWSQTSGTTVSLSGAATASPTFTAPELLANQNLEFSLAVNDGTINSTADSVTVTVRADNDAPTAEAGSDQTVDTGASVTLSGSGSDPEGRTLTYAWSQTSGTTVSLSGATTARPTFTAPSAAATLEFSLAVNDGVNNSTADSVTVTVTVPPTNVLTASPNPSTTGSYTVSGSFGTSVNYELMQLWERLPDSTTATYRISDASNISQSFSSKPAGTYGYRVQGCNYELQEGTFRTILVCTDIGDLLSVTVTLNTAPVADAGADQTGSDAVTEGDTVTLDGSGSSDADSDTLEYDWSQTLGTTVMLSSATAASPTFTAPELLADENLVFSLAVNDGTVDSTADSVTVTVRADNDPPVADAGEDQTVDIGTAVTLDGTGSTDPEHQTLYYTWSPASGTGFTLSSTSTTSPTFTAPMTPAVLSFTLSVSDNINGDNPVTDTVTVTVGQPIEIGTHDNPHILSGPLQVSALDIFSLIRGTGGGNTMSSATYFRFTVPEDRAGEWTIAIDGTPNSGVDWDLRGDGGMRGLSSNADESDEVTLTAGQQYNLWIYPYRSHHRPTLTGLTLTLIAPPNPNVKPVAHAGADQTGSDAVTEGDTVTLDGSGSSDADSDTLEYDWSQTLGTTVMLSSATAASPTFTAPELLADENLVFSLAVNDGTVDSTADSVTVTVRADNDPPVADAGEDQTVDIGTAVTLDGTGSTDPEHQTLYYTWSPASGTGFTLSSTSTTSPTFTAPMTPAVLSFTLSVSDNINGDNPVTDTVTVTVRGNTAPVADAGADQTGSDAVTEGDTVTLDGSGSSDADSDTLEYEWSQTSGTTVSLSGATTASPTFTAPELLADENLVFSLVVNDGTVDSTADSVTVTVRAVVVPLVADAGEDQTVDIGTTVTLDGSGSSDADTGDTLTYAWSQTSGTTVMLSGATTASPTFTAPATTGALVFSLVVNDGTVSSTADTVTVTVGQPIEIGTHDNPHILSGPLQVSALDIFSLIRGTGGGNTMSSATYFRFTVPEDRAGEWTIAIDGTPNSGVDWDLKGDGGLRSISRNADESDEVTLTAGQQFNFRIYPYRANDRPALTGLTLTLTAPPSTDPMFPVDMLDAVTWIDGIAIEAFTVPAATGGNGTLIYTASDLPTGVTMSTAREVSGTPTAAGTGTATVTVTDSNDATDTLTFAWTVEADTEPVCSTMLPSQTWTQDRAITAFSVPAATGGNAPLAYTASGLPSGVMMSADREVTGTPTATGMGSATVTVTDNDGDTATTTFAWTVEADTEPMFASTPLQNREWTEGTAGTAFTVSAASSGNGTLTYTASGLPSGITMSASRSVSGTATRSGSGTAIVTAQDRDGDTATVRFAWTVSPGANDLVPSFGSESILNRDWIVRQSITSFTAPAAMGGDGTLAYAAEGLPDGVTMSAARVVSGLPTATGFGTARITAQDADGDFATLTFHWTVTTSSSNGLTAAPNPSTDGTFTVSGSMTTRDPDSYLTYQMIETEPGGAKNTHSIADPKNISLSFSDKSDGTYSYQMQRCDYYSTSTISGFVCTDIGSSLSVSVKVGLPAPDALMGPDTDADGTYTIAWSAVSEATGYELQQSRNGGAWTDTAVTGTPTTKAFTVPESGEYQYRIRACDATRCSDWSAIKMVLVNLPPTVGFDSTYVVRTGDLGPDNDTDIYLSPLATGTGNVGEFILRNDNGTFALEISPTVAQLASAQSWTVSTQVEIVLEDVNVDGVWDAFVTGISGAPSTANFEGAVDQIVVSPATSGGKPTGLVAVDNELKDFVDDVMAWYLDTTHFDYTHYVGSTYFVGGAFESSLIPVYRESCYAQFGFCNEYVGLMSDFFGSEALCLTTLLRQGHLDAQNACTISGTHFYITLAVAVTTKDFSNVSLDVGRFVTIWTAGEPGYQVEDLADVLEDVLDIIISGVLGERIDEIQQSLFNLYALFGAQGRGTVDNPTNKVIVTKRRVVQGTAWGIGRLDWHAVLEFPLVETYGTPGFNPTIAAYEDSGELVARRNDPSERNNLFAGTVTLGPADFISVWIALANSDRNYRSCPPNLDYRFPLEPFGNGEYNSNGYISGIIISVNGVTNAPIGSYLYGSIPVPNAEFQNCD